MEDLESSRSASPPSNSTFDEQWSALAEANGSPGWVPFVDTPWNSDYGHASGYNVDGIDPALLDSHASPASDTDKMTTLYDDVPSPPHDLWRGSQTAMNDGDVASNASFANMQASSGDNLDNANPWQYITQHRHSISEPPEGGFCYIHDSAAHASPAQPITFHRGGHYLGVPTQIARLKSMPGSQNRYSPYGPATSTPKEKRRKPRKATSQHATLTRSEADTEASADLGIGIDQLKAMIDEAVKRAVQDMRADLKAQMENHDFAVNNDVQTDGELPVSSDV